MAKILGNQWIEVRDIFNRELSLETMRRMDGERVYVFAKHSWAVISMEGPYPLLMLEDGNCISWEDCLDVQMGGIYRRPPALKILFARIFSKRR